MRYDRSGKVHHFAVKEKLFSRNYFGRYRQKAAVILRQTRPVSYDLKVGNGVKLCHESQLQRYLPNLYYPSKEEKIICDIQTAFYPAKEEKQEQAASQALQIPQAPLHKQLIPKVQAVPLLVSSVYREPDVIPKTSEKAALTRRTTRQAATAAAAAALLLPTKTAQPPVKRTLRPLEPACQSTVGFRVFKIEFRLNLIVFLACSFIFHRILFLINRVQTW